MVASLTPSALLIFSSGPAKERVPGLAVVPRRRRTHPELGLARTHPEQGVSSGRRVRWAKDMLASCPTRAERRHQRGSVKALVAFSESCANPYPPAGCSRGCELNDPRSRERRDAALFILQAACNEGDGHACLALGLVYDQSLGVKGDSEKARGLLEKACAVNVPTACYRLAYLLSFGSEDLRRAQQLYRKACERGLSAACDSGG
jgi:TPR repeat protein